ncbi:hypothetical protein AncyloWKF20_11065 [Ancylobacter sp. WKF20]|uniref:hypothetical protein n=1 Tax=Ancylobacter sp. WKF20 TaxID=3039801 RepID=UPI0024344EDE|nr:hypothetical protein [Ancylobacter sp. WKF20]WGD32493.1 hypothetical protein AncyloWKF20_11065 [Ancylobacter sp. WKF20]
MKIQKLHHPRRLRLKFSQRRWFIGESRDLRVACECSEVDDEADVSSPVAGVADVSGGGIVLAASMAQTSRVSKSMRGSTQV